MAGLDGLLRVVARAMLGGVRRLSRSFRSPPSLRIFNLYWEGEAVYRDMAAGAMAEPGVTELEEE